MISGSDRYISFFIRTILLDYYTKTYNGVIQSDDIKEIRIEGVVFEMDNN